MNAVCDRLRQRAPRKAEPYFRGALVAAMALFSWVAAAHHSYGMFDLEKERSVTGAVVAFEWTNPHAWLKVEVSDEHGIAQVWRVEMGPPGQLARTGWRFNSLRPGDKVTVAMRPLRDGAPGGHLLSVTTAEGKTYYDNLFRQPPPPVVEAARSAP